jgi:phenylacetate-CoA ligase
MGRADQSAKVRGLFVHPGQIADLLKRHDAALKGRLVITRNAQELDDICLQVETEITDRAGFESALTADFQTLTKLRVGISLCQPGSLPNDGKVIDDQRPIDS